jgi:hypothetical protein
MTQPVYTYLYLREDGTPYYVGMGSKDRAFRKHDRVPVPPALRILIQNFPSREEALVAERFLVSFYGRKDQGTGCLWNFTDGGDINPSFLGKKHRPDTIEKMKSAATGRRLTFETIEKIRSIKTDKHPTVETRQKMKDSQYRRRQREGFHAY